MNQKSNQTNLGKSKPLVNEKVVVKFGVSVMCDFYSFCEIGEKKGQIRSFFRRENADEQRERRKTREKVAGKDGWPEKMVGRKKDLPA